MREDLPYLIMRYEQEVAAADGTPSKQAQIAHLELAFRYAMQAAAMQRGRRHTINWIFAERIAHGKADGPELPLLPPAGGANQG